MHSKQADLIKTYWAGSEPPTGNPFLKRLFLRLSRSNILYHTIGRLSPNSDRSDLWEGHLNVFLKLSSSLSLNLTSLLLASIWAKGPVL
jgi:hypothetical protein